MTNESQLQGFARLQNAALNKSTAFTEAEREQFGLRGLLPPNVADLRTQQQRVLGNLRRQASDIDRYVFLRSLQNRNQRLFYRTAIDYIEEIMPLVYTPTVGQACKEYAQIFRETNGFYITPHDRGQIRDILNNWPEQDIRVIVITDGERILGLGDLGANGMGIPIGKSSLYIACAGIQPHQCLPVMLDVGTETDDIRDDPMYLGLPQKRLRGDAYFELVDEFVTAVQDAYPQALIQFEDFATNNAYALLHNYRDKVLCFNDDIQGTAAVALAGVFASTRISGYQFEDLTILFLGAGSAATGIADLMVPAFVEAGLTPAQARERLWFVDSKGLVVKGRNNIKAHSLPYATEHEATDFIGALHSIKPQILIGATGRPAMFTQEVIELMATLHERPTIFALSNPTSRAECTAEQAYNWSEGRAIFASGSPFPPVNYNGMTFKPGQGNNSYIFPGIGLGAIVCQARCISDEMFLAATHALAELVSEQDLNAATIYPPLTSIRDVSLAIAVAVAEQAYDSGLATAKRPENIRQTIIDYMYNPGY